MALPLYSVRRAPKCTAASVEATIAEMVVEGYEIVSVYTHSTVSSPNHDGRFCAVDIVGVKK